MDNSLIIQEEKPLTEVKPFSAEEAKNAYLAKNLNSSMSHDFWSFEDVKDERDIPAKIKKAETKLAKAETEEDFQEAMEELRKYKRVGLLVSRFEEVPIDNEGEIIMRPAVIFYDPFTAKEITMKQTIAVNTIKGFNAKAGTFKDGEEYDETQLYIRGIAIDCVYEGRKKNQNNNRLSDRVDIKLSNQQ